MKYADKAEIFLDKGMKEVSEQLRPIGFLTIQSDPSVTITAVSEAGEQFRLGMTDVYGRKIAAKLPEGYYHLVLSRAGYYPASERVEITKGKVLVIERKLDPSLSADEPNALEALGKSKRMGIDAGKDYAQVRVICNVKNASIYQGKRRLGAVGEYLYLQAYKQHDLLIKAPGCKSQPLSLSLSGAKEDYKVNLVKAEGTLIINANVDQGSVYCLGKRVGRTGEPIQLAAAAKHVLEVRAVGHKPIQLTVQMPENSTKPQTVSVTLKKREPVLKIWASVPSGYNKKPVAEIIIDGKSIGRYTLPLAYDGLNAGTHTVAIGRGPWIATKPRQVTMEKGKRVELKINLKLIPSYLEFDVTPAKASIYIDGRKCTTHRAEVVAERPHEVRIWAKGYKAVTGIYEVQLGQTNRIAVKLTKKKR